MGFAVAAAVLFCLCAGAAVGTSIASLFAALDIIPRLNIGVREKDRTRLWQSAVIVGGIVSTMVYTFGVGMSLGKIASGTAGLLHGVFVGLLAGALTEVLNIIPILTQRLKLKNGEKTIINALIIGKTMGALFFFLVNYFSEVF